MAMPKHLLIGIMVLLAIGLIYYGLINISDSLLAAIQVGGGIALIASLLFRVR